MRIISCQRCWLSHVSLIQVLAYLLIGKLPRNFIGNVLCLHQSRSCRHQSPEMSHFLFSALVPDTGIVGGLHSCNSPFGLKMAGRSHRDEASKTFRQLHSM